MVDNSGLLRMLAVSCDCLRLAAAGCSWLQLVAADGASLEG